jgi:adenylylsulfate reductase subunit B
MPPIVNEDKCIGCGNCMDVCPGDLMVVDPQTLKAYCREPRDCWDCMSCNKACPVGAIKQKLPYQLGYYPAELTFKQVSKDTVLWTIIDIMGNKREVAFTVRGKPRKLSREEIEEIKKRLEMKKAR